MFQWIYVQWADGRITREWWRVYSLGDRCMDFRGTNVGAYARQYNINGESLPLYRIS